MGIRFFCPNGHKLNVKAFLAGERGICPQCDAKFLVPAASGGQVESIEEVATEEVAAVRSGDALHRGSDEPPPLPPPPSLPPATEEVWYVRMAAGEQFGPAGAQVMRGWIAEGRVPVDCWVWKTGWPEWKPGGQAITLLNVPGVPALPGIPTVESKPSLAAVELPVAAAEELPAAPNPTTPHLNSKRNRQERARKATLFLGVLVLMLIVVLVAVLMKK